MVSNTTSDRETAADHTPRLHGHLKKLGFEEEEEEEEEEEGQLREWMTGARDGPKWEARVESQLDLPPGSFTNLRTELNKHERKNVY
jgi:hypothetical protein